MGITTASPIASYTVFSCFYINNSRNTGYNTFISANNSTNQDSLCDYGVRLVYNSIASGTYKGASNQNEWFGSNTLTPKYAFNNGINYSSNYNDTSNNIINSPGPYYDSSWNRLSLSLAGANTGNFAFRAIGVDGYDISGRSFNGYMLEILCHNKSMGITDMTDYSNNKLF